MDLYSFNLSTKENDEEVRNLINDSLVNPYREYENRVDLEYNHETPSNQKQGNLKIKKGSEKKKKKIKSKKDNLAIKVVKPKSINTRVPKSIRKKGSKKKKKIKSKKDNPVIKVVKPKSINTRAQKSIGNTFQQNLSNSIRLDQMQRQINLLRIKDSFLNSRTELVQPRHYIPNNNNHYYYPRYTPAHVFPSPCYYYQIPKPLLPPPPYSYQPQQTGFYGQTHCNCCLCVNERFECARRKEIEICEQNRINVENYQKRSREKMKNVRRRRGRKNKKFKRGFELNSKEDLTCCLHGCGNKVSTRTRFSLKLKYSMSYIYRDITHDRICNRCYFSDRYSYYKSLKGVQNKTKK